MFAWSKIKLCYRNNSPFSFTFKHRYCFKNPKQTSVNLVKKKHINSLNHIILLQLLKCAGLGCWAPSQSYAQLELWGPWWDCGGSFQLWWSCIQSIYFAQRDSQMFWIFISVWKFISDFFWVCFFPPTNFIENILETPK